MNDLLGDRMKMYESLSCPSKLLPNVPLIVRLDGVSFHTFTKGLKRPFDIGMSSLMIVTTAYLVEETNACCGYTQSDEITLILNSDNYKSQVYFDGRLPKILSVLPSKCSVYFNKMLPKFLPSKSDKNPVFDCRVFTVPNKIEAINCLVWREKDATRNSISMAAQSMYSHKELQNKNSSELQEMIFTKGINWNDYPAFFKRGSYIRKKMITRPFTTNELEMLPPKHEARINPNLTITRSEIEILEMQPITKVKNIINVVFNGEEPKYE